MYWGIRFIASTRFVGITIWSENSTDATPAWLGRTVTSGAECGGKDAIREAIVCMGDVRASATVIAPDALRPEVAYDGSSRALCRVR
jgi:hypothetical protein